MLKAFFSYRIVRKIGVWLFMLVLGAILRKLTGQTPKSPGTSRKYVKNKAK